MTDHRAVIFDRIQQALDRGRRDGYVPTSSEAAPQPPDLPEGSIRQFASSDSGATYARFVERIKGLGDTIVRVANMNAAKHWLLDSVRQRGFASGVADRDAAKALGIDFSGDSAPKLHPPMDKDAMFAVDFGVTLADFGIAETGSLAIFGGAGRSRLSSLVPPVHYCVLRLEDLLPDVWDAVHLQAERAKPGLLVWISGSSRTADIDGIMIHGAHGPKELFVIVVDE
ncbi:lactate utilization protein [Candidatus Sumerlaeota bacterium]|nr:lactate utilization protein [Candidatus Sumerlaeota bacterium]